MKTYLQRAGFFFRYAWLFSLFINVTLLLSPLYMLQVYDRVLASRSLPTLAMLTLGVALGYLVYIGLETLRSRVLVQAGLALDGLLCTPVLDGVFKKAARLGGPRHATALRDVAVLRQYLTGNGLFAFFDAPWGIAFLAIIFIIHWMLGLAALFGMLLLLGIAYIDDRSTRGPLQDANALSRDLGRYADGAVRNADVIEAMGMRGRFIERWNERNAAVLAAQNTASNRAGGLVALSKGLRQLLQSAMLGLGAYLVITENLSSGTMIAATLLLGKATAPLELAIAGWKGFVEARAAYGRLDGLLKESAGEAPQVQLPAPTGAYRLEHVSFAAGAGQPLILKDVSFELEAGGCLAIIGPSAAGKSTLVRIMLGLWQPLAGSVRLDGARLADWSSATLGPQLGYLPQDTELLAGTVAENIARLAPASASSDAVVAAARLAGAHDMVLQLPQGYDTPIGDGASSLSGGQRQRIGLARALFGEPRVVVLDEPNSNLDSEGESALVEAIKRLKARGATVVFVTHKPSLLNQADKVLVLDGGSVLAFGARDVVLARMQTPAAVMERVA